LSAAHRVAIDVGCGTGQLTFSLARYFDHVLGLDPSAEQIQQANRAYQTTTRAEPHQADPKGEGQQKIAFIRSPAEAIPCADGIANLITAAQAAHWFDLPRFYAEARRVAGRDAVLALISYGVPALEPALDEPLSSFYWNDLQAFWPPERKLVDQGYQTLDFPFTEISHPKMAIECQWDLPAFLGYLSTWSAVKNLHAQGHSVILRRFAEGIERRWGEPSKQRLIRWPLSMRVGRL